MKFLFTIYLCTFCLSAFSQQKVTYLCEDDVTITSNLKSIGEYGEILLDLKIQSTSSGDVIFSNNNSMIEESCKGGLQIVSDYSKNTYAFGTLSYEGDLFFQESQIFSIYKDGELLKEFTQCKILENTLPSYY